MSWLKRLFQTEDREVADVRRFHQRFNLLRAVRPRHLTTRKLQERCECLQEELDEFRGACAAQDLAAQADALVDLVYFAKGTAVALGLPWDALWADVQRANLAKVPGVTHRGHAHDVTKPPGWVEPRTGAILAAVGYDRARYEDRYGVLLEGLCHDDCGGAPRAWRGDRDD